MIRQPTPQQMPPLLLGPDPSIPSFPSHESRPHTLTIRDHAGRDYDGANPAGIHAMPQQYAHPLPRSHSYNSNGSSADGSYSGQKQSEHMLRRKTPNGILNAAYDGTSVEQAERPHAMKHILLPVSQHMANSPAAPFGQPGPQDLSMRMPGRSWPPTHSNSQSPAGLFHDRWIPDAQPGMALQKHSWPLGPPQPQQMDSMLNGMPTQIPLPFQHIGVSPYGFMPPSAQSAFGPTASNDSGSYGPYWPNGMFEPYRPAEIRDMRFYPHHSAAWTGFANGIPQSNWLLQNQANAASFGGLPPVKPYHGGIAGLDLHQPNPLARMTMQPAPPLLAHRGNGGPLTPTNNVFPSNLSVLPFPSQITSSHGFNHADPAQFRPTNEPEPEFDSVDDEFGSDTQNSQLREKVFTWAHSIYVDLLRYLKELRSRNQGRGGHHPNRGSMYPKPPRQPSYDFSSRPGSHQRKPSHNGRPSETANQHAHHHGSRPQSQSHNQPQPHPWPSQAHEPPRLERNGSWTQPSLDPSPLPSPAGHGLDQLRTLRRTSGSTFSLSHIPGRTESSPTSNASSALGALTELCQESEWKWVDGMLLGGCLAYALADYQKAMDWYTKILKTDPK